MKILVTGAAGFVGSAVCKALCERGNHVTGLDNLNDYYDVKLKQDRLKHFTDYPSFSFHKMEIADAQAIEKLFEDGKFDRVVHLAAQAGVRYSIDNPSQYVTSNLVGFANILEACRRHTIEHLVFASSSSIYGANTSTPFKTDARVDHPISFYAATKRSNEMMAHSYSHLFNLPVTGLRFFTVYGPWGRPDMAPIIFARKISQGETINVHNFGKHSRDFTYIDDIVSGVIGTLDTVPTANPQYDHADPRPDSSSAPYRIYNIGQGRPTDLMRFIGLFEENLGKKAKLNMLPMQPGEVESTWADTTNLQLETGFQPTVSTDEGVRLFIDWFRNYYGTGK